MADLPPGIMPPDRPRPGGSSPGYQDADILLVSAGAALFVASQVYSKTYPHLAAELSKNIIGAKIVAGERVVNLTRIGGALLMAPAPFGFVPPEEYGLEPNYLAGFNKFLTYQLPSLGFLKLPESELLKTLPDTDPRVQKARYNSDAFEQEKLLRSYLVRADVGELLDLYQLASGPQASKLFFRPEVVLKDIEQSTFARVGRAEGQRRLASAAQLVIPAPQIPSAPGGAAPVPSLIPVPGDIQPTAGAPFQTTGDLFANLIGQGAPARPLNTPPSSSLQQEANGRAPPLLRELVSERSDP